MGTFKNLLGSNSFLTNVNFSDNPDLTIGGVTISDDFTTLNTQRWQVQKGGNGDLIVNGSGQLEITFPTNLNFYEKIVSWENLFDITDKTLSLDIITHSVSIGGGNGAEEAYLYLAGKNGGSLYIYESNNTLLCRVFNKAGTLLTPNFNSAVANTQSKWRIRHTTAGGTYGTLYLETFDTGTSAWVTRAAVTTHDWSLADGVEISIQAGRYSAGGDARKFVVDNLLLSGESGPPTGSSSMTISDKLLTKTAGGTGWNAGAVSKYLMLSPQFDQSIRAYIKCVGHTYRIGWASDDTSLLNMGIGQQLAFNVNASDNVLTVNENGSTVYTFGGMRQGNEIRIQIIEESGQFKVKYYWRPASNKSENLIYTSTLTDAQIRAMFPLYHKVILNTQGAIVATSMEENGVGTNIVDVNLSTVDMQGVGIIKDAYIQVPINFGAIQPEVVVVNDTWMIEVLKDIKIIGNIFTTRAPSTGTVIGIDFLTEGVAAGKTATFDILKNGVSIFANPGEYLTINNATPNATSPVTFDITEGDKLDFVCMSINTTIIRPAFLRLIIEQ